MGKVDHVIDYLEKEPSSIDARDDFGNTPLHFAAHFGRKDVVLLLLEKGALLEGKNNQDETPLFSAVLGGQTSTVKLLVEQGADITVKNENGAWLTSICSRGRALSEFLYAQWRKHLYTTSKRMKKRILWIDDNIDEYQAVFWEWFMDHGVGLVTANNNDDALQLLRDRTEHFDLLVQDFQRPPGTCLEGADTEHFETTGIVFYERFVHELRPELPCVYVTGEAKNPRYVARVKPYPRCFLFGKPVEDSGLEKMVKLIEEGDVEGEA